MNGRIRVIAMLTATALAGACGRSESSGPPELRLGRDECAGCGMIITEGRCASALLSESDGLRSHQLFDDIGCMLDFERSRESKDRVINRYVHDYATGAWVPAGEAAFVLGEADRLRTPMGSGVHAFGSRAGAEEEQRRLGGEILDFGTLVAARARKTERPDGKPAGGD